LENTIWTNYATLGRQIEDLRGSGVARVPYALGQEILLRPLSTKTTGFVVKNRVQKCGRSKT